MTTGQKWKLLFIKDERSMFDSDTKAFDQFFNRVDKVIGREEALKFFEANSYDIVLSDLSVEPEEAAFLKQIKDINAEQTIFALVSPKDTDKLYGIADMGVNAFELTPEYFDQALEQIAAFDPYAKQ